MFNNDKKNIRQEDTAVPSVARRFVASFTSHNRTVYASGAIAPSGYEKPQSAYGLCAVFLRHIFASPENLRFPLSGLQKRHIQPERYAKLGLNQ
jgi:hypothetical protein